MLLNNRNLCESCFSEISQEPCPFCGYRTGLPSNDPIALSIGTILNNRYRVGRVLGKGGFGITYAAYDSKMSCLVAIKEYCPMGLALRVPGNPVITVSRKESEASFRKGAEKFYEEASMVSQFNGNRNIISVYDFFYENDTVYYSMGYLNGQSLKSYIATNKINEGQAVMIMQDISNALVVTHSMNVLHRDISPDNIMLCDDGTIKLIDFGAARQVIAEQSQSLSIILKQGFAPLEQYQKRGKQGPWTDIYALGATIYNAITGDTLDDPMTRMDDDSIFLANKYGISENLWKIITKCVMLKSEDRYQDIFELKKDLNSVGIEPEPIVDAREELLSPPIGETAKSYESRLADNNATLLLSNTNNPQKLDNRTVAMDPADLDNYPVGYTPANVRPKLGSQETKESVYQKAIKDLESNNAEEIKNAIDTLQKLKESEDAREYIRKGKRRLRKLKEREKQKKRVKLIICIAAAIVVVGIALSASVGILHNKAEGQVNISENQISALSEHFDISFTDDGTEEGKKYAEGVEFMNSGKYYEAFYCFNEISGYHDADTKKNDCKTHMIEQADVDSIIVMGQYNVDLKEENGNEPIEWIVLDKKDNSLFVTTKNIIDELPFDTTGEYIVLATYASSTISACQDCTWGSSSLRKWLNNDFLSCFDQYEASRILTTTVDNSFEEEVKEQTNGYYCEWFGEEDTEDQVFILSKDEMFRYPTIKPYQDNIFNGKRVCTWCRGPDTVMHGKLYGNKGNLKLPTSYEAHSVYFIRTIDNISDNDFTFYDFNPKSKYGIRPAMWIKQ